MTLIFNAKSLYIKTMNIIWNNTNDCHSVYSISQCRILRKTVEIVHCHTIYLFIFTSFRIYNSGCFRLCLANNAQRSLLIKKMGYKFHSTISVLMTYCKELSIRCFSRELVFFCFLYKLKNTRRDFIVEILLDTCKAPPWCIWFCRCTKLS